MGEYINALGNDERAVFALRGLYESRGYERYKMSRFEEYDLYVKNKDFLVSEQVITFTDRSGRLLALKPDVTLSIIKNTQDKPDTVQKLYYNENVYRIANGTQSFREILQTGLECIGDLGEYECAEVLLLAAKSLATISERFMLDISHMGFVLAVLEGSGLSDGGVRTALECLRRKNLHELDALCISEGVGESDRVKLLAIASGAEPEEIAPLCSRECEREALGELERLYGILRGEGFEGRVRIDFSVANDMKYYSGVVFNGYIEGIPSCVLSGGQYDRLLEKMGSRSGAIGFALYVDMLERLETERKGFDLDSVLLRGGERDTAELVRIADTLAKDGRVLVASAPPEQRTWRKLYRIERGEAVELENND